MTLDREGGGSESEEFLFLFLTIALYLNADAASHPREKSQILQGLWWFCNPFIMRSCGSVLPGEYEVFLKLG